MRVVPLPETRIDPLPLRELHLTSLAELHDLQPDREDGLSANTVRSRRRREVRSLSLAVRRTSCDELEAIRSETSAILDELDLDELDAYSQRPKTRGECASGPRPCPYVSCKYHLAIDVDPRNGSLKINFPDVEPGEWQNSCALDVADHGGITLEAVGELVNVTRERIRQLETILFDRIKARREAKGLHGE